MASRAIKLWRSFARPAAADRGFATAATEPRVKAYSPMASFMSHGEQRASKSNKLEFVPVYVAVGLIVLSASLGLFTAEHQIAHNPSVRVSKKRREELPEITDPDRVVNESDQFVNKSLFRKVARVQDFDAVRAGLNDPTRPDPFRSPRRVETLKSVGVDPRGN